MTISRMTDWAAPKPSLPFWNESMRIWKTMVCVRPPAAVGQGEHDVVDLRRPTSTTIRLTVTIGASSGSVMRLNCCQRLAPSTVAAS